MDGQPFVRCARCKADSFVTAVVCSQCEAPLGTAEQRAFNEKLWRRLQAERADEREAVARIQAARAQADRDTAHAARQRVTLEQELEIRRGLGLGLEDPLPWQRPGNEDDASSLLTLLGRGIGRGLRWAFPHRGLRLAFVGIVAAALVMVLIAYPRAIVYGLGFVLLLLGSTGRARFRFRRRRF
jgi:hypothetical protein